MEKIDLGGKTITWNEQEIVKLIKEKEKFLEEKEKEVGAENA